MEYNELTTIGPLVLVIVLGVVGLIVGTPMGASTVMMMVAPSMLVFGGLAFFLGMKYGESRSPATR
jgi:hypothetical protein